jgi:hypothetical protein
MHRHTAVRARRILLYLRQVDAGADSAAAHGQPNEINNGLEIFWFHPVTATFFTALHDDVAVFLNGQGGLATRAGIHDVPPKTGAVSPEACFVEDKLQESCQQFHLAAGSSNFHFCFDEGMDFAKNSKKDKVPEDSDRK